MTKKMIGPVRSEADYDAALVEIERYFENEPERCTPEADRWPAQDRRFVCDSVLWRRIGRHGRRRWALLHCAMMAAARAPSQSLA